MIHHRVRQSLKERGTVGWKRIPTHMLLDEKSEMQRIHDFIYLKQTGLPKDLILLIKGCRCMLRNAELGSYKQL